VVTLYGPADTLVPDGYDNPGLLVFSGSFNTNDVLTLSWTSVTAPVGWNHNGWAVIVNGVDVGDSTTQFGAFPQAADNMVFTCPSAGTYTVQVAGGGGYRSPLFLTAHGLQLTASAFNHCQYGTELQVGAQFVYYLTPTLIDTWLAVDGLPWLDILFTPLWFTFVNAQTICGSGPPPLPVIDLSTLEASISTILQVLHVVMWPNVCRCTPGTPSPNNYPAPAPAQPTGWPTAPAISCSNADICATLVSIQAQVAALQRVVGSDLGLTTLLQRYRLPFATIDGAKHSTISGAGTFLISRLIGMRAHIVTPPAGGRTLGGTPTYIEDVGWMSIMDGTGMIQERRIAETDLLWMPDYMADATVFGYYLRSGVVVDFTEVEAEP
jgi:hypothetical protein